MGNAGWLQSSLIKHQRLDDVRGENTVVSLASKNFLLALSRAPLGKTYGSRAATEGATAECIIHPRKEL